MKRGRKPQHPELAEYIPPSAIWAVRLERELVEQDIAGRLQAAAIRSTLDRIRRTGDDGLSRETRSRYRKQLAELGTPPWLRQRNRTLRVPAELSDP